MARNFIDQEFVSVNQRPLAVLLTAVLTVWLCLAGPAWGQGAPPEKVFDIPSLPLADALRTFSLQSGLKISGTQTPLPGINASAVNGSMTVEKALDRLLAGSGLTWRPSGTGEVALMPGKENGGAPQAGRRRQEISPLVVTGEREERSLLDTAASVTVFDADTLDSLAGTYGTNDVYGHLANVVSIEPSNYAPAIRGIDSTGPAAGANAFFAGVRPRLTLQVDGRPASFNELLFSDVSLWDVAQVEVFRGSQSTVQGRNAIAGTVVVKTKDPTWEPESAVRTVMGENATRRASAMVSGPVADDLLAMRLAVDYSGWESIVNNFENYDDTTDPGDYEYLNLRGKLLFLPKSWDGFSNMITFTHSEYQGPQGELIVRPFEEYNATNAKVPTFNPVTTSGVMETTWEMGETIRLENILSYTDIDVRRTAPVNTGNVTIDGDDIVWEPRLHFTAMASRLTGFAGYYGMRADQDEAIDLMGGGTFEDETTTNALFIETVYALSTAVDLTFGMRYEEEDRRRKGGAGVITVDYDKTYDAAMPKFALAWHPLEDFTVGGSVTRGYNGGGAGITWAAPFTDYTYDPEYVWNYELFARKNLLDKRLQLTGNIFYSDYTDLQLPYSLGTNSTVIRNADEAIVYGLEAGAHWLALEGLELFGEAGLLKTEITSYANSGYENNELPRSPAFTLTAGAIYRFDFGVEVSADVKYTDAYYSDAGNSARGKIDPYAVASMKAGYTFGRGRIFAYVKNLLDEETPVMIDTGSTASADTATMLQPRSIGAGVEFWF